MPNRFATSNTENSRGPTADQACFLKKNCMYSRPLEPYLEWDAAPSVPTSR
eukprot:SAG22_NODE_219_length_14877_cov_14.334619_8_plen_51_part_00